MFLLFNVVILNTALETEVFPREYKMSAFPLLWCVPGSMYVPSRSSTVPLLLNIVPPNAVALLLMNLEFSIRILPPSRAIAPPFPVSL